MRHIEPKSADFSGHTCALKNTRTFKLCLIILAISIAMHTVAWGMILLSDDWVLMIDLFVIEKSVLAWSSLFLLLASYGFELSLFAKRSAMLENGRKVKVMSYLASIGFSLANPIVGFFLLADTII